MSKLTELFKSISTTLHLPELTKPLWEAVIAQLDDLQQRLAIVEKGTNLPPELVAQLVADWERYQKQKADRAGQDNSPIAEAHAQVNAIASSAAGAEGVGETPGEGNDPSAAEPGAAAGAAGEENWSTWKRTPTKRAPAPPWITPIRLLRLNLKRRWLETPQKRGSPPKRQVRVPDAGLQTMRAWTSSLSVRLHLPAASGAMVLWPVDRGGTRSDATIGARRRPGPDVGLERQPRSPEFHPVNKLPRAQPTKPGREVRRLWVARAHH